MLNYIGFWVALAPNDHRIADFRKINPQALKTTFKLFVLFLKDADLITGQVIAMDGTKIRANNSKKIQLQSQKNRAPPTTIDEKLKPAKKLELQPWFVLQQSLTRIIKELPPNTWSINLNIVRILMRICAPKEVFNLPLFLGTKKRGNEIAIHVRNTVRQLVKLARYRHFAQPRPMGEEK